MGVALGGTDVVVGVTVGGADVKVGSGKKVDVGVGVGVLVGGTGVKVGVSVGGTGVKVGVWVGGTGVTGTSFNPSLLTHANTHSHSH